MNSTFRRYFAFPFTSCLGAIALLLMLSGQAAQAQIKIYAQFGPNSGVWAGELTGNRAGWAELKSISFGSLNDLVIGTTGGAGAGKATFQKVTISKVVDRLTPQFFATLTSGATINTGGVVTVEFTRQIGGHERTFFKLEMKLVVVSEISTAASDGDDELRENVSLLCGAIRVTNSTYDPEGTLVGNPIAREWSVVKNNATFETQ